MTKEDEKIIEDFVITYFNIIGDDKYAIERYVDYRERFPQDKIDEIINAENIDEMYDCLNLFDDGYDDWSYEDEFFDLLSEHCKNNNIDYLEAQNYVFEHFYWTYPEDFMNPDVNLCIHISAGDNNYDFTRHNMLNYNRNNYGNNLSPISGLGFLAKQQGYFDELNEYLEKLDTEEEISYDSLSDFSKSCVNELKNIESHMSVLTFVLKLSLSDAMSIKRKMFNAVGKFDKYHPLDCKDDLGKIVLTKDTVVGLMDIWGGTVSNFEIKLDKNVEIPIQFIWDINTTNCSSYGYGYAFNDIVCDDDYIDNNKRCFVA